MNDISMHTAFVPQGCEHTQQPQAAVTLGAGTIGIQAYEAVTTRAGKYVQGGGCLNVGLAGLVQSGGFGSYSKHYGSAAGSLLEAEVVTADGQTRIANACINPDLFWALKGGGGGTFGVISKMTLRLHDLPEFFGFASFKIKAASDDAYQRLLRQFVSFYCEHLYNDHWGEQAELNPDNALEIKMVFHGLDTEGVKKVWQPFLDWVARSRQSYSVQGRAIIGSLPARHMWDVQWWKEHWPEVALPRNGNPFIGLFDDALAHLMQPILEFDDRPGAGPYNAWWKGDGGQVAWFIWGYESLWLPASLLETDVRQQRLANALFAGSRYSSVGLHFIGSTLVAVAAALDHQTQLIFAGEIHGLGDVVGISCRDRVHARFSSPCIHPSQGLRESRLIADVVWIFQALGELFGCGAQGISFQERKRKVDGNQISTDCLIQLLPRRLRWPCGIGRTGPADSGSCGHVTRQNRHERR